MKSEPIRVLQVVGRMDRGGIETMIMNLYRNIDREKVQFDFLAHFGREAAYNDEIHAMGGRIYEMPALRDEKRVFFWRFFSYLRALRKFFREHKEYKVIHGHMTHTAALYMPIAKKNGVSCRIQINPAEDIDLPSQRESALLPSKQRDAIPREMIGQILSRFPEGHSSHLPIMLAYHCGLRKGEVFGLSWDMVDLEEGLLYVRRQMQRCRGRGGWQLVQPKYNSCRRVRLDPVIWDLLRRTREQQLKRREHYGELYTVTHIDEEGRLGEEGEEIELVLIRDDGSFIIPEVTHNISYVVRKELGYELFDFHSLRHTHATELCENGVNLKEIQRRLGHKSFEVTNRIYLHATDAMERESMEIMKKMYDAEK